MKRKRTKHEEDEGKKSEVWVRCAGRRLTRQHINISWCCVYYTRTNDNNNNIHVDVGHGVYSISATHRRCDCLSSSFRLFRFLFFIVHRHFCLDFGTGECLRTRPITFTTNTHTHISLNLYLVCVY